jgi:hypothetical protein
MCTARRPLNSQSMWLGREYVDHCKLRTTGLSHGSAAGSSGSSVHVGAQVVYSAVRITVTENQGASGVCYDDFLSAGRLGRLNTLSICHSKSVLLRQLCMGMEET